MSNLNPFHEALRQVSDGEDFFSADDLTRDLSPEQACKVAPGAPYSVATQVGHMLFWQDRWLDRIQGQPVSPKVRAEEDFPTIDPTNWVETRARLIGGIQLASSIAAGVEPSKEVGRSTVGEILLSIAIHNAYHVGQIAILRQISGLGMPAEN